MSNSTLKLTGLSEEEVFRLIELLQIIDLDTGKIVNFDTLPTKLASLQIHRVDPISIHYEEDLTIIRF